MNCLWRRKEVRAKHTLILRAGPGPGPRLTGAELLQIDLDVYCDRNSRGVTNEATIDRLGEARRRLRSDVLRSEPPAVDGTAMARRLQQLSA